MKIVIDTNVVISGVFFGGAPRRVLEAVTDKNVEAYATAQIVEEYCEVIDEMIGRRQGALSSSVLTPFISRLHFIDSTSSIKASRDPDDDKFIECAVDSGALYIVSGDKDLLVLKSYEGIEMITAADFCRRFLDE